MKTTSWKQVNRSFSAILNKVGNPPIRLVTPTEFHKITGYRLGHFVGRACFDNNVITIKKSRPLHKIKDTLWHEIAHLLFPSKPHWWIECFAAKINNSAPRGSWQKCKDSIKTSGTACGRYSLKYCKSKDDLPSKSKLLDLACKSAKRMLAIGG